MVDSRIICLSPETFDIQFKHQVLEDLLLTGTIYVRLHLQRHHRRRSQKSA